MRSVKDKILFWLVDVIDELDPITIYDNYLEALVRIENMLKNDDEK